MILTNNPTSVSLFTKLLIATGSIEFSILFLLASSLIGAAVVHWLVFRLLMGVLETQGPGRVILNRVRGLVRLAMLLLALAVVLPAVDFDPSIAEAVRRFLSVGMAILLGWSAIVGIDAGAKWVVRTHRVDVEDNLAARRVHTQTRILERVAIVIVVLITAGAALLSFPSVRAYGFSLFASAGAAGLILGFAARPVLSNIIAGVQIALTQPIRIDDVVIVEGQWGWVEEITTTYVVIRVWDLRRLIVPLSHFIEKPFENWTRETSEIIGAVTWHLDYRAPVSEMRTKLSEILAASSLWDGKVSNLQVVDSANTTLIVRALMSSRTSPKAWDLRCEVREKMIEWLRTTYPEALPVVRAEVAGPNAIGDERLMSK